MKNHNTKNLIVNTLINLMQTNNLSDIFVKEIATNANITRQTFYRHFKDKYDVINWYYDQEVESLFTSTYSIEGIRNNLIIKCKRLKQKIPLYKNAYQYKGQNSLIDHEFNRMFESLSLKIKYNTGIPLKDLPLDLTYTIEFYCHGVIQLTINWLNQSCPLACEKFADILIQLIPKELKANIKSCD